jgi:hypothetical protein
MTVVAVTVCAYAACDLIHEVAGHGTAALLSPTVEALSLSTVALQTTEQSRFVAAAGSIANAIAGITALLLARRLSRFDATHYFLLLLGAVNLLNATGYLLFSAILGIGDWAVVIGGMSPQSAWRVGMGLLGAAMYGAAIVVVSREVTRLVLEGKLAAESVPRLIHSAYVAGGLLLVAGAAMNPISPVLILTSGVSAGFGAMAGLLLVPGFVAARAGSAGPSDPELPHSRPWIVAGLLCALVFVFVIGRGIQL